MEVETSGGKKHRLTENGAGSPPEFSSVDKKRKVGWRVESSLEAKGAINNVRLSEEKHFKEVLKNRDQSKELIKLSIGDPAVFGNLPAHPVTIQSLKDAVDTGSYNGYGHSRGLPHVREAVARKFSVVNKAPLTVEDVIMTSSCSGALEHAVGVLANAGQNVLVPKPGFALYNCLTGAKQIEVRSYRLKPDQNWEADIDDMDRLVDENTAAIIINNPSNPCGSVYSKEHMTELADFAAKHYLPVISDEIYAEMIFSGSSFHSIASVSTKVPALVCGGLSKQYMIPGWRIGWILIHDPLDIFKDEVRDGLSNIVMKTLGPCTVVQAAVPGIIQNVPAEYHERNISILQMNAELIYDGLSKAPGLNPIMPSGAMYLMVGINIQEFPEFNNDIDFTKQLVLEESVFCLPGDIFKFPNFFRVVLIMPREKISEAVQRITQFCIKHHVSSN